jgi:hypothetical protein
MRLSIPRIGAINLYRDDYSRGRWTLQLSWGARDRKPEIFETLWIYNRWFDLPRVGFIYCDHNDISVYWTGRWTTVVGLMWNSRMWMFFKKDRQLFKKPPASSLKVRMKK